MGADHELAVDARLGVREHIQVGLLGKVKVGNQAEGIHATQKLKRSRSREWFSKLMLSGLREHLGNGHQGLTERNQIDISKKVISSSFLGGPSRAKHGVNAEYVDFISENLFFFFSLS